MPARRAFAFFVFVIGLLNDKCYCSDVDSSQLSHHIKTLLLGLSVPPLLHRLNNSLTTAISNLQIELEERTTDYRFAQKSQAALRDCPALSRSISRLHQMDFTENERFSIFDLGSLVEAFAPLLPGYTRIVPSIEVSKDFETIPLLETSAGLAVLAYLGLCQEISEQNASHLTCHITAQNNMISCRIDSNLRLDVSKASDRFGDRLLSEFFSLHKVRITPPDPSKNGSTSSEVTFPAYAHE